MVRFKNRWLLLELTTPSPHPLLPSTSTLPATASLPPTVTAHYITSALRASIQLNFGDFGAGTAGSTSLQCKYYSSLTKLAIVRCSREWVTIVWAAATFLRRIAGKEVAIRVLHCGGTIKKTQLAAIRYDRRVALSLPSASRTAAASRMQAQVHPSNKPSLGLSSLPTPVAAVAGVSQLSEPSSEVDSGVEEYLARSEKEILSIQP